MTPKQHQAAMKQGGFDPGVIDGVWGPHTAAACSKWYASGKDLASVDLPVTITTTDPVPPIVPHGLLEPAWLARARSYIGQREVAGTRSNPFILRLWTLIRAPFTNDSTAWCAAFCGGMLEESGIRSTRSAAARSYLNYGVKLSAPRRGCIVVFERGPTHGHVAFVVGRDSRGQLLVLGGNQRDQVCIEPRSPLGVLDYRWPSPAPNVSPYSLQPVV